MSAATAAIGDKVLAELRETAQPIAAWLLARHLDEDLGYVLAALRSLETRGVVVCTVTGATDRGVPAIARWSVR